MIEIVGAFVIPSVDWSDSRGRAKSLRSGLPFTPVAELLVLSGPQVVRGLHYQKGLSKVVRCVRGMIVDVLVDLRVSSPTFGKSYSRLLVAGQDEALYVPDGVAHGICVPTAHAAEVLYQFSALHDPALEGAVFWNDPALNIPWGGLRLDSAPVLSERDKNAPTFSEYKKNPVFP